MQLRAKERVKRVVVARQARLANCAIDFRSAAR